MEVVNHTPFVAEATVLLDKDGQEILLLLIKATYKWVKEGVLAPADEQAPIHMADVFYGEPGKSSVKYASDLAVSKPGTDVALLGHAYALKGKGKQVDVSLEIGPIRKMVRVFGDRVWEKGISGLSISSPSYFDKIPLVYERAFGGSDTTHMDPMRHGSETRNPVGTGYRMKSSKKIDGTRLPNLEDPKQLISSWKDCPEPAAFGFIGRDWEPRRGYAGTYDESWAKLRNPLLPQDFDDRYFLSVHPTLVIKDALKGGEWLRGVNLSSSMEFRFQLPRVVPKVVVRIKDCDLIPAPKIDTLVVEPDLSRTTIVWGARTIIHRRLHNVREIYCEATA
ncbi:MAG TPA: DUF2169 domain-containing protein [Nitrospira sp.]|nr:DUF2169 domain-containing protein [Nitrospira sp.]